MSNLQLDWPSSSLSAPTEYSSGSALMTTTEYLPSDIREHQAARRMVSAIRAAVEHQLTPLLGLQANWDSYGAPAIDVYVARRAAEFMVTVITQDLPLPYVVPTSRGGIALEWKRAMRELTVEFDPASSEVGAFFADDESGSEWELPIPAGGRFLPALFGMGN